jgi:hypothetical protein
LEKILRKIVFGSGVAAILIDIEIKNPPDKPAG